MINALHKYYPSLYGSSYNEDEMDLRYKNLINKHKELFSVSTPLVFSSSGRTEIAGNQTDHNLGLVIGASINLDTIAAVSPRLDEKVVFYSEGFSAITLDISNTAVREEEKNTTSSLIRGIANSFKEKGIAIKGFNANISSNVMVGSGLSSSASIEVLLVKIFDSLYNNSSLSSLAISKIGQEAENKYFGKPCGLLDQLCCSYGGVIAIDFKDKEDTKIKPLELDLKKNELSMVITNTQGCHANLTEEYSLVPNEMRKIAAFFGKENLREIDEEEFYSSIKMVREKINNDRAILRAHHFFSENKRVQRMVEAIEKEDISSFLLDVKESGDSSYKYAQNVYPASSPREQGLSIAIAVSERVLKGRGAVRVHGGGFAGTIQAYVPDNLLEEYINNMEKLFLPGCSNIISIRTLPVSRLL